MTQAVAPHPNRARIGRPIGKLIFSTLYRGAALHPERVPTSGPVILVANKSEGRAGIEGFYEAFQLGLGEPVAISAEHGEGICELAAAILYALGLGTCRLYRGAPSDSSDDPGDREDAAADLLTDLTAALTAQDRKADRPVEGGSQQRRQVGKPDIFLLIQVSRIACQNFVATVAGK